MFIEKGFVIMKKIVSTENAPAAIGPYSQAVKAGNTIYVSGQLPIDPLTGNFPAQNIKDQTRQSLTNIKKILEAEGYSLKDVVKVHCFMADLNDFVAMNEVYAEFFTEDYPARVAVQVARLPKDALVEIDATACKD